MMARSRYEIAIDTQYQGRGAKEADKDMKALDKTTTSTSEKLKGFAVQGAAVGAALTVMGVAAKQAYEFIGEGADLAAAAGKFDNLSGSINTTGDLLLGKMKQATKGLISDADLIAAGTDIMSLGLAKTEGGVVRMAAAVGALNLDMGVLALTLANDSTARLDSLGLSLEDVTQKKKELIASGFIGDAFDEAVLIALEEKMLLLGDASETTAGQMQIAEAAAKDITDTIKIMAAEIAAVPMKNMADEAKGLSVDMRNLKLVLDETSEAQVESARGVDEGIKGLQGYAALLNPLTFSLYTTKEAYDFLSDGLQDVADSFTRAERNAAAQVAGLERNAAAHRAAAGAIESGFQPTENLGDVLDDLAISHAKAAGAAWDQAAAEEAAATAQGKAAEAAVEGQIAFRASGFEGGTNPVEGYEHASAVLNEVGVNAELAEIKVDNLQGKLLGFEPIYGTIVDVDTTAAQARVDRLAAALGSLGAARAIAGEGDVEGAARAATGPGGGNVGAPGSTQYAPGSTGNQGPARYTGEADYDPLGPGAANGANFTVPPGFPNDSFPMRVQSGEHVQVTPAGQQRQSGGTTNNFYNQTEAAQALALATVAQQKRANHSAFMGG